MKLRSLLALSSVAMFLSACSEQPQLMGKNKSDTAAYTGAKNGFVEKNWNPGDKTSWEMQLRARAQNQNEYTKTE